MTSKKFLIVTGIFLALFLCLFMTTNGFGLINLTNRTNSLWLLKSEFWATVLILYLYAKNIERDSFLLWTEEKKKLLFHLLSPVITIGVILLLLTIISILRNHFFTDPDNAVLNSVNQTLDQNIALYIFSAVTAGITEELIFRGYLLPRLQLLFNNKWAAILLSSLLFGLAHYTYSDLTRIAFPFIIGIIFSYHYSKYRSLLTLIISHLIIDLVMI